MSTDRPEPKRCRFRGCPYLTRHPSQLCGEHREDVALGLPDPGEPNRDEHDQTDGADGA